MLLKKSILSWSRNLPLFLFFLSSLMTSSARAGEKDFLLFYGHEGWALIDPETGSLVKGVLKEEKNFRDVTPSFVFRNTAFSADGRYADFPFPAEPKFTSRQSGGDAMLAPDGKRFIFRKSLSGDHLYVFDLVDGTEKRVTDQGADPIWLSAERIIYREGPPLGGKRILAITPDGKPEPKPVFETAGYIYRITQDGSRVLFTINQTDILTLDLATGETLKWGSFSLGDVLGETLSPDGKQVAFLGHVEPHDRGQKMNPRNIWVIDGPGAAPRSLLKIVNMKKPGFIFGKGYAGVGGFDWSPDGKRIAFSASFEGDCYMSDEGGGISCKRDFYVVNQDGTGLKRLTKFKSEKTGSLKWVRFTKP